VRRILRSRGAPSFTVDDALQTAAERSLLRAGGFDSLQGWINWSVKVAWHEVQAQWKREARSVSGEPADAPCGPGTEYVVEHQLELEAALRGLVTLTDSDREAIMSGLEEDGHSVPLAAREKMHRYRARRRLAALVAEWDDERDV
jgi:DNA-directed RNA polymerase specialized sigma24 family protein